MNANQIIEKFNSKISEYELNPIIEFKDIKEEEVDVELLSILMIKNHDES